MNTSAEATTRPGEERTLVNWDVVGKNLQALAVRAQREWNRLTG